MNEHSSVAPLLFARREPSYPATAEQYLGTDAEQDVKGPTLLSARGVPTSDSVAEQFFGTDTELDVKDSVPPIRTPSPR